MALVVKDRVQETSTTTGTGTFTLAGAVSGFQSFSAIGNGNTTYYSITDGTNWEVGVGTYTSSGTTLSRDTVLESSNSDNLVDFGAGSKFVFCTYPADKSVYADASSKVSGYAIENSTIGATTASTGRFTSVTTPSVTATSTDLTLSAISTGNVNLATLGGTQFKAIEATGSVNVWNVRGGDGSTTSPRFTTEGTGTNIAGQFNTKGTGALQFFSGNTEQMRITNTASAVNYVQVTGAATTGFPAISAQGSDTNIGITYAAKGSSRHVFTTGNGTQFRINDATSSVNTLETTGAATGLATRLYSQGSDTNISLALLSKGTGAIDLAAGSSGVNISNGGTVTAITRTAPGSGYTSIPTTTISPPTTAGGVQAVAYSVIQNGAGTTIANGGTGYTVGNVITMVGGTLQTGTAGTFTVSAVSSGVITAVTVANFGQYNAIPTNPVSVTGGSGSGATLTVSYIYGYPVLTNNGSGYIEQPTVTFSGGGGSGASAYATVGSMPIIRSLAGSAATGDSLSFYTPAGESVRIKDQGVTSNGYVQLQGSSATSNGSYVTSSAGSLYLSSGASSAIGFFTNGQGTNRQFNVTNTASAVNYVQVTGGATGAAPVISAQGSDGNIELTIKSKGTGNLTLQDGNSATGIQILARVASGDSFLTVQRDVSKVNLAIGGAATNADIALTPKGTGLVRFGTYVAGALTATGYINIKAADGTTYKVLVST